MKNQIIISESDVFDAYKNGTQEDKKLLEKLFGKDTFKPKDITERVKTFEDACIELGRENCLVQDYLSTTDKTSSDLLAYIKLRIICAALNEGWKPQFTENERRYHVWIYLYTEDEYKDLDENDKKRFCHAVNHSREANNSPIYVYADYGASSSDADSSSRLVFKSRELAEYCEEQFFGLWYTFLF